MAYDSGLTHAQIQNRHYLNLYNSLKTIIHSDLKKSTSSTPNPSQKPLLNAAEQQGNFQFDGLKVQFCFAQQVILPSDVWNSSRVSSSKLEVALHDVSAPIVQRMHDKWGSTIRSIKVAYRENAPFSIQVVSNTYSFRSDAALIGVDLVQGNPSRLGYILFEEGNLKRYRRGLCQIQRVVSKTPELESVFVVYPGYVNTLVFPLRDKSYFTRVEQNLR